MSDTTLLMDQVVDLPFKGNRTYLHGTDLYPAAVQALESVSPMDEARFQMAFRGFAKHACRLILFEGKPPEPRSDAIKCEISAVLPEGRRLLGWFLETDAPVDRRIPFDEDAVMDGTVVEGESISLDIPADNTVIEHLVAITKGLHYRVAPIDEGRWVFSKLDLVRPLRTSDIDGLTVSIEHRLGERLTRSDVSCAAGHVGNIFFSVGHP